MDEDAQTIQRERRHYGLGGTGRPNAPAHNRLGANGSFSVGSYSGEAVSAANPLGLVSGLLPFACRRAGKRGRISRSNRPVQLLLQHLSGPCLPNFLKGRAAHVTVVSPDSAMCSRPIICVGHVGKLAQVCPNEPVEASLIVDAGRWRLRALETISLSACSQCMRGMSKTFPYIDQHSSTPRRNRRLTRRTRPPTPGKPRAGMRFAPPPTK